MIEIGSSDDRGIGKPDLTTKAGRHGEKQEIQGMIFGNFGIAGNSWRIGVRS
jgi:hypothetical protein